MKKPKAEKEDIQEILYAILEELRKIRKELERLNGPIRVRPDTWPEPDPWHPIKPRWGRAYLGNHED